jgi:hypothetical protein
MITIFIYFWLISSKWSNVFDASLIFIDNFEFNEFLDLLWYCEHPLSVYWRPKQHCASLNKLCCYLLLKLVFMISTICLYFLHSTSVSWSNLFNMLKYKFIFVSLFLSLLDDLFFWLTFSFPFLLGVLLLANWFLVFF